MLTIVILFLVGSFLLFFWSSLRHSLLMLQQNGYFNDRFIRWLRQNPGKMANYLLVVTLFFSLFIRNGLAPEIYITANGLLFLVLALLRKKKPEKVPLAFTWRIRRLLVTIAVLCFLIIQLMASLFWRTFWWELPWIFALMNLLLNAILVLANRLNRPLESAIARRFIRDARRILAEHPGLTVIGITGSFGKTSTKNILDQILRPDFEVLSTPESYNTTLGVVRTIRERLTAAHQVFIVEMGAKKPGDIKEICDVVKPSVGVLSSIGEMHLETFLSMENIINTKFELADAVGQGGLMFLNDDNTFIHGREVSQPVFRYGVVTDGATDGAAHDDAARGDAATDGAAPDGRALDAWAEQITSGPAGSQFTIRFATGEAVVCRTGLLGKHNVLNIVAAASVAVRLGVNPHSLARAVSRLEPVPHRLQLLPPGAKYQIIDDAYNANPEGAKNALEALGSFPGYRVLITPGIVELGEQEEEANRTLGAQAAQNCDYIIFVGRNRSFPLEEGAKQAGFNRYKIYVAEDIRDALAKADQLADQLGEGEGPMTVLLENDLPDQFL